MLDIAFHDFVAQDVRREINRIANMFVGHHHAYTGPRINVLVTLSSSVSLAFDDTEALGAFIAPVVLIAGYVSKTAKRSRSKRVIEVGDTFIHELLHLERWIHGKPQTERGIEAKVKRIRKANKWL